MQLFPFWKELKNPRRAPTRQGARVSYDIHPKRTNSISYITPKINIFFLKECLSFHSFPFVFFVSYKRLEAYASCYFAFSYLSHFLSRISRKRVKNVYVLPEIKTFYFRKYFCFLIFSHKATPLGVRRGAYIIGTNSIFRAYPKA